MAHGCWSDSYTNNPREPFGFRGLLHDMGMSRYGWDADYEWASGGAAEGADVVIGSDVDDGLGAAALVIAKCIVDEKSCGENEHGGEECDCVHSCIIFNC